MKEKISLIEATVLEKHRQSRTLRLFCSAAASGGKGILSPWRLS
jgi:hypothetical protein